MTAPPALQIGLARLHRAQPGDADRLAAALEAATPAATGVPDHGLLLIRRLALAEPLGGAPGRRARFAAALVDGIRAAKAGARRPGDGAAGEGDLYFEDLAAADAALVRGMLAGHPAPLLAAALPDGAAPLLRWRRHVLTDVRHLPIVLSRLLESGLAGAWLAHFEDSELRLAADRLLAAHEAPTKAPPPPVVPLPPPGELPAVLALARARVMAMPAAPGARRLALVAACAASRPDMLASTAFARLLADITMAAPFVHALGPASARTSRSAQVAAAALAQPATAAAKPANTGNTGPKPVMAQARPASRDMTPTASPQRATARAPHAANAPVAAPRSLPETAPPTPIRADLLAASSLEIGSNFAGLFFLFNAFTALALYGDFTRPHARLPGLSPFALLAWLGRRWFGAAFVADPLHGLLRELAGLGPRQRLTAQFEAPVWAVPSEWLVPWPRARPQRRGRALWHPAGFVLAHDFEGRAALPTPARQRQRWLHAFARYLQARMDRAADGGVGALSLPGVITVKPDAIMVGFALETHPISLRLAGLDRDPGFVPAAARTIGFVFS
ncbi:hypothetical protein [Sandarakinorhabdus sp.]|uniref:hypothetical protein n=1 Tax=Sandarakinorhabdus sp. TaxID=1916663 RepID=UPI00286D7AC2|nr:hypothetical protein [Sandarakinorhabdus sp.]